MIKKVVLSFILIALFITFIIFIYVSKVNHDYGNISFTSSTDYYYAEYKDDYEDYRCDISTTSIDYGYYQLIQPYDTIDIKYSGFYDNCSIDTLTEKLKEEVRINNKADQKWLDNCYLNIYKKEIGFYFIINLVQINKSTITISIKYKESFESNYEYYKINGIVKNNRLKVTDIDKRLNNFNKYILNDFILIEDEFSTIISIKENISLWED